MGKLVYSINASLDGYIEDEKGSFDWSEPQEDVHNFYKSMEEQTPLTLYGRRMYETMAVWESDEWMKDFPAYIKDFARAWRKGEKIVYSRTLTSVTTGKTSLRREFDPVEVQRLKNETGGEIGIGGANLAGEALARGLVDEVNLMLYPVVVGGGKPAFRRGLNIHLRLEESRQFEGGIVMLRYSVV